MTIDRLTDRDLSAALRLSTQAGWNQLEADWRRLLTLWPNTCFAGRENGQLLATSTLATYGRTLAWVGMVLVDEAHRGRGLGGQILDAALDAARALQIATVCLDATDFGRPVYLKRGFRDVAGIDRWTRSPTVAGYLARVRSSAVGPDECARTRSDLKAFNQRHSAIDRTALLDGLEREPGVKSAITSRDRNVTAFAVLRPGRLTSHLGPVIADTEADAILAMEQVLSEHCQSVIIDVPRGRMESWLTRSGFTVARRLTRMCLGADSPCLLQPGIFAATSFELG